MSDYVTDAIFSMGNNPAFSDDFKRDCLRVRAREVLRLETKLAALRAMSWIEFATVYGVPVAHPALPRGGHVKYHPSKQSWAWRVSTHNREWYEAPEWVALSKVVDDPVSE
jgi:hypothetical protein